MKKMVEIEIDIAFEDEEFGETLERLNSAIPESSVKILRFEGPAGGWPQVIVTLPEEKIGEFAKWYCEADATLWEDAFLEEAREV